MIHRDVLTCREALAVHRDHDDWLWTLVYDLKGSCPGLGLALDFTLGSLVIGILRIPVPLRGRGHGPRILRRVLAEADARGFAVVCTPTGEYGSDRELLVRALTRAGFRPSPGDPTGHTMRRPPATPTDADR